MRECGNVQTTKHSWECPIIPVSGEFMDFVGQQLKDNVIKIAEFWEKK